MQLFLLLYCIVLQCFTFLFSLENYVPVYKAHGFLYIRKDTRAYGEKGVYTEKRSIVPASCGLKFSTVIALLSGVDRASLKAVLVLPLG